MLEFLPVIHWGSSRDPLEGSGKAGGIFKAADGCHLG